MFATYFLHLSKSKNSHRRRQISNELHWCSCQVLPMSRASSDLSVRALFTAGNIKLGTKSGGKASLGDLPESLHCHGRTGIKKEPTSFLSNTASITFPASLRRVHCSLLFLQAQICGPRLAFNREVRNIFF